MTFTQTDPRLAAMDIGWAQELFGSAGRISSIQILLEGSGSSRNRWRTRCAKIVPADTRVAPPAARSQEMKSMLGAFQLNVTAMSLVSLVVGMFLICNSVGAAVIRRRVEIAILRANGATRGEVRRLFLCEAALEAVVGVALGIWLAPLLAGWIAQPVSHSISSLYELVRIENPALIAPANARSGRHRDVSGAHRRVASRFGGGKLRSCAHPPSRLGHRSFFALAQARFGCGDSSGGAAFGLCVYSLKGGSKYSGFAAAGAIIAGFSLLVPWLALAVAFFFRSFGVIFRLATNHFARSLHRNTLTIAALAAAIAMTISVTVMIDSFRGSVQRWIDHTLTADLYIAPAVNEIAGLQAFLPAEAEAWAEGQPDVLEVGTFRELSRFAFVTSPPRSPSSTARRGESWNFLQARALKRSFNRANAWPFQKASRPDFEWRRRRRFSLPTPAGVREFTVCGIYRDFARDRGTILMPRTLFDRYWQDKRCIPLLSSCATLLREDPSSMRFANDLEAQGQFALYDNAALRQRVFDIFDETFAVTSVLRSIAIIVASAGVLFSLSALVIEREREIGVLRAMGASRPQVLGVFLTEAALIALTAALSGLASGGALAMVLTWVINQAFFGWTIDLSYPTLPMVTLPLWIIGAALLAALLPAWRAARIAPARAVRFE